MGLKHYRESELCKKIAAHIYTLVLGEDDDSDASKFDHTYWKNNFA
jgi:hypothetical protein